MSGFFDGRDDDRGSKGGGVGSVVMRDAGPLPVWGWLLVGVAAVFLYRAMTRKPGAAAEGTAEGETPAYGRYPTAGGIYVLPSSTTPVAGGTPAAGKEDGTASASNNWGTSSEVASAFQANAANIARLAQQYIATGQVGGPNPGVQTFFAHQKAAKALGVPYIGTNPVNPSGPAVLINPVTGAFINVGATLPLQTSSPYLYQGLYLGRSGAWSSYLTGTGFSPSSPAAPAVRDITGGKNVAA